LFIPDAVSSDFSFLMNSNDTPGHGLEFLRVPASDVVTVIKGLADMQSYIRTGSGIKTLKLSVTSAIETSLVLICMHFIIRE
jgi:hypothetical protein